MKRIRNTEGRTYALQFGPLVVYVDRPRYMHTRSGGIMVTWRGRRRLAEHVGWRLSVVRSGVQP